MTKKAVMYIRVSGKEQLKGYSLEAQEDACRAYAQAHGLELVKIYAERGRSADQDKLAKRVEFKGMIQDALARRFDVVLIHKLDRFARSVENTIEYFKAVHEAGLSVESVTEGFDYNTPTGKLQVHLLAVFAEHFLDNLKEEIKKGKIVRFKRGEYIGRLAYGYTTPIKMRTLLANLTKRFQAGELAEDEYRWRAEEIEKTLERYGHLNNVAAIPCPFEAPIVRMMFELFAEHGYIRVIDLLAERGIRTRSGKSFKNGTLKQMFRNRFYIGEVYHKDMGWKPGNHEPLISQELFERCQEAREFRKRGKNTSLQRNVLPYPLTGILICIECGYGWHGWPSFGKRYYRDRGRDNGRRCYQRPLAALATRLESQARQIVVDLALALPQDWVTRVLETLEEKQDTSGEEDRQRQRAALEGRLLRLKTMFEWGDMGERDYKTARDELQAQLATLQTEPEISASASLPDLNRVAALLQSLPTLIDYATPEEQKRLYAALFRKLYVGSGNIVAAEPTPVCWQLLQNSGTVSIHSEEDTPPKQMSVCTRRWVKP